MVHFDNLCRAFFAARHGKRKQPAVQAFEYELEPRLWAIHRELEAGNYQWGAYRQFRIYDPKQRVIRAAPFCDRVVHHAIFNVIDPLLRRSLILDTYACIPARGARTVLRHAIGSSCAPGAGWGIACNATSKLTSLCGS